MRYDDDAPPTFRRSPFPPRVRTTIRFISPPIETITVVIARGNGRKSNEAIDRCWHFFPHPYDAPSLCWWTTREFDVLSSGGRWSREKTQAERLETIGNRGNPFFVKFAGSRQDVPPATTRTFIPESFEKSSLRENSFDKNVNSLWLPFIGRSTFCTVSPSKLVSLSGPSAAHSCYLLV